MLKYIRKYKSVLWFVLTFLGTYLLLSAVYNQYLKLETSEKYYPDYITHQVAVQSEWFINKLGYTASIEPHEEEPSMKLIINNQFLARVVEGCNAVSVIILFCAFVLAFFDGWKKSILFLILGAIAIYIINVIRIGLLAIAIYEYPQYSDLLHTIVFPLVIYGFVFLLWIYWIHQSSIKAK